MMESVEYNMSFQPKNLNKIISILNEQESKQTVFSAESTPLSREDKKGFVEALRSYSALGEVMYGKANLKESVEQIVKMVEMATRMVSESEDDMVDKIAANRHMKYLESSCKDLQKSANEVMIHEKRMAAAYEDIAEGLRKYYDVE
tara:strand:+ start:44 stop:481 length:438 start_codon:yes stop_codon:yes gene_type:complete